MSTASHDALQRFASGIEGAVHAGFDIAGIEVQHDGDDMLLLALTPDQSVIVSVRHERITGATLDDIEAVLLQLARFITGCTRGMTAH